MPVDQTVALPSRRDPASLRGAGLLPPPTTPVVAPTKAHLTGPVVAHLDPGHLAAPDGRATIWSFGPTWIDSYHGTMETWKDGPGSCYLNLEFWGFPPATDAMVSVSLRVSAESEVRISATGNPVTMSVVGPLNTGSLAVVAHVPIVADSYCLVSLEPVVDGHGFDWFGADLRTV